MKAQNRRHPATASTTGRYALAAACDDCAHLIGSPEPEHGIRMAPVHASCVAGLEDLGWVLTYPDDPGEPPDICCEHYHQAAWTGGHDDCCASR